MRVHEERKHWIFFDPVEDADIRGFTFRMNWGNLKKPITLTPTGVTIDWQRDPGRFNTHHWVLWGVDIYANRHVRAGVDHSVSVYYQHPSQTDYQREHWARVRDRQQVDPLFHTKPWEWLDKLIARTDPTHENDGNPLLPAGELRR